MDGVRLASGVLTIGCGLLLLSLMKKYRRPKRWGVRPVNALRKEKGEFANLFQELKTDPDQFFKYTRMTLSQWEELLKLTEQHLKKNSIREAICPEERLAITIRYLAHGGSMQTIAWSFRVGKSTVSYIIRETTKVLWMVLSPIYLKPPNEEDFKRIAENFWVKWNMPNCCGAIDGKHVVMQAPKLSGSQNFNYKHSFSTVLLAVCDADYNFIMVDVGAYGSQSDGGIFMNSSFGRRLNVGELGLPNNSFLPNTDTSFPYFFIGDEAFPLKTWLMRPFPGRLLTSMERKIYNYRLSRARRTIENTFGILVSRFRILRNSVIANEETVNDIIGATVVLHNFIKKSNARHLYCRQGLADYIDAEGNIVDGEWRNDQRNILQGLGRQGGNNYTVDAGALRDTLCHYFVSLEGNLPFQWDQVERGRKYSILTE